VGRLNFAGEAGSRNWFGFLQGAWHEGREIGESVAESILIGKKVDVVYGNASTGSECGIGIISGI
jgi:polyamine oxidase